MPKNKIWKEVDGKLVKKIRVYFYDKPPDVRFRSNKLDTGTIIDLLKAEWNCEDIEDGEHVPGFEEVTRDSLAHILVSFNSDCKL